MYSEKTVKKDMDLSKVVALEVGNVSYRMYLPNSDIDYIQQKIAESKVPYEHEMLQDIRSRLADGEVVLDIGANIGNHTLFLAAVAGCQVVAFEPNAALAEALTHSITLNNLHDKVKVLQVGLGKCKGQGEFKEQFTENLGAQSIAVGHGDIEIVALDSVELSSAVRVIKLDVEGMELAVLEGGQALIARDRPFIYVECINDQEFKTIASWMAQRGYAYWDTFNATPTHLFLPQEYTSLEQRLERLQFKEVLESYRTTHQLQEARRSLAAANQKYRDACGRIDALKAQISQSETARGKLAEELAQGRLDLEATREELKAEHQRLAEQERAYVVKLETLALGLNTAATERLDKHNSEQELRAQLLEARRTLDSERARCVLLEKNLHEREQLNTQQAAELLQLRERISELRQAYDALSEELEMLKQQCEEHISSRLASDQVLAATREQVHENQRQLESAHVALDNERTVFIEQVTQLNQRLSQKADVIHAREQRIAALEAELNKVDEQFSKLVSEQRSAAVHHESVTQQLEHEQAAKKALESVLQATEAQFSEQQQQLSDAQEALEQLTLLRTAEHGEHSDVIRQLGLLKEQHENLMAVTAEKDLTVAQLLQQQAKDKASLVILEQLQARTEEQAEALQRLTADAASTAAEKSELYYKIEILEAAQLVAQRNMDSMHKQNMEQHQQTVDGMREHYEQELRHLRAALDEQHQQIERITSALQAESERRQNAEQRLIKTRASLTYQLGYQIKNNATSFNGLIKLPGSLFSLYRQANQQRKQRVQPLLLSAPVELTPPAVQPVEPVLLATREQTSDLLPEKSDFKNCKIACVMDEFTFGSYAPEAQLLQLTPHDWEAEITAFSPDMLFIESAWRGKDELWGSKVGHNASELQHIVRWCNARNVPTIFWNKEDPVHFETFLTTAKQFDHVFTTDMDCIHRYKAALGHDRVYFLPFACQPNVHNPIELYERKDAFCFAGAYYARYPERTRDLGNFVSKLPDFRPVEIYDRNYGKDDPNYQFPAEYQPFIVGTLPFSEIDRAYKGYRYAINLNSIKQSQTMFARRVYELLGCNTVTVSNYSRGVRLMFGDLVITTDSGDEMVRRLQALAGDEENSGKLRLAALRKVMIEHTYEQRLNYILAKVNGASLNTTLPTVAVVAYARNEQDMHSLVESFKRQTHTASNLYLVLGHKVASPVGTDPRVHILRRDQLEGQTISQVTGPHRLLVGMVAEDYYGPNYLTDMAVATRYSRAHAFGKVARYTYSEGTTELLDKDKAYQSAAELQLRCAAVRAELFADVDCFQWVRSLASSCYSEGSLLALDPYNYCHNGASAEPGVLAQRVDDLQLDTGFSIDVLQARAEKIAPAEQGEVESPQISLQQLQSIFGPCKSSNVSFEMEEHGWLVTSTLEDGKHEYVYAAHDVTPAELGAKDQLKLFLDVTPGLNLQLVLLFLDAQKQRISHVIKHANRNKLIDLPPETAFIRMGWRVYQGGCAEIKGLLLGHKNLQPADMLGQAEHLLVTNHYPSYDDLYRNGFVHSRVAAYRERGVSVDVFRLRKDDVAAYHEFENIDVITGSQATLKTLLDSGRYRKVLVHFLDPDMWQVLKNYIDRIKVVVWVHGAEVQPWWRREYNYSTEGQLQIAKLESEGRMAFWHGIISAMPENLKLIFVSRYFAEEVMEDVGVRVPEAQYEIIHNPINTDIFSYLEKPVEQRKKILSIRPYASPKYANDLSAKAIQLLAKEPFFHELEFRMIGDGPLFDEILDPLRIYPNVKIERRFLKQHEIAALHKEYGVFLCPTRMDAQGVSRDEAMASGLIPVTNAVAAIPEFVNEKCGFMVPAEDAAAIANAIKLIYLEPENFTSFSSESFLKVKGQTSSSIVLQQEISAIVRR